MRPDLDPYDEHILLIRITEVEVLSHYHLRCTFSDGLTGDCDVSDIADHGGFWTDMHDPDYFAQVRVNDELGTIEWPNGIDMAPETLYIEAVPVEPS